MMWRHPTLFIIESLLQLYGKEGQYQLIVLPLKGYPGFVFNQSDSVVYRAGMMMVNAIMTYEHVQIDTWQGYSWYKCGQRKEECGEGSLRNVSYVCGTYDWLSKIHHIALLIQGIKGAPPNHWIKQALIKYRTLCHATR